MEQIGLFGIKERLESLSKIGDPLEKINKVVSFEAFRGELEKSLKFSDRGKGGRPPYDAVLILKVLILQTLYNLSDDQIEYQIKDRLSFMRFLGLTVSSQIPDAKTVWLYRERLSGTIDKLFKKFNDILVNSGYLAKEGQIMDATIVQVPRQRMKKEEKEEIKNGDIPQDWSSNKASQKDIDARYVIKYSKSKDKKDECISIPYYGYKNHISTDCKYGFIRKSSVTAANIYDGHMLSEILDSDNEDDKVYGDKAYNSQDNQKILRDNGYISELHCKKPKGKSMPLDMKKDNKSRSKIRAKIEHVFAAQKDKMGLFVRTIGIKRAKVKIGLANLAYNIKRYVFFEQSSVSIG